MDTFVMQPAGNEPLTFTAIRSSRASTQVVAQIRDAIMAGRYVQGDRLPTEREMARQFGVSRVTIRDALRALEAGGLIEVRVGGLGGPYVAQPDPLRLAESLRTHLHMQGSTFAELAEARLALETTATRLAAERAQEDDLARMRAALEELPGEGGTASQSVDFHSALVQSAHNSALLTMFLATRALLQEAFNTLHARQPDMAEVARRVHRQLYEAIERRDGELAVRLMRDHLYEFAARAERAHRGTRRRTVRAAADARVAPTREKRGT
jgi:GntR family transcriptional regulator, transcriptional repressor for pyruvate dehydrogenase complex